jgi:uncharacterized C2H2 Zn-finger protein
VASTASRRCWACSYYERAIVPALHRRVTKAVLWDAEDFHPGRNTIAMADTLLRSLGMLVEEKRRLVGREKQLAKAEQRVIAGLSRSLSGLGYRVRPVTGQEGQPGAERGTRAGAAAARGAHRARRRTLQCPKCDRRFSHPLPMARHMSATHRVNKTTGKAKSQITKR